MNSTNNKWIYVLLVILIIITAVNLWISKSRNEIEFILQRDSLLQLKIDSISQAVNDFRTLYDNDLLISDKEQKITNNYITYKNEKTLLLKRNADSIYNWTKHKLSLRTE